MRKLVPALMVLVGLLLVSAPAVFAASGDGGGVTIMVMKHACNDDIKNLDDFNAVKQQGADANGPAGALAATVLACPTIVNPGDEQSDAPVVGEPTEFDFTLEDSNGTHSLPASTMPAQLCEEDLQIDADGDPETNVCLDITHYVFEGVADGPVTLTETRAPDGYKLGELLFTPSEIDGNNDAASLQSIDRSAGVIELDTSADEDGSIMLHVYNFAIEMPDSATLPETVAEAASSNIGLLIAIGVSAAAASWMLLGRRRESVIAGDDR